MPETMINESTKPGTPVEVYAEWQDGHYIWHPEWAFVKMDRGEAVVGQTGSGRVHGTFREHPKNVRLAVEH